MSYGNGYSVDNSARCEVLVSARGRRQGLWFLG